MKFLVRITLALWLAVITDCFAASSSHQAVVDAAKLAEIPRRMTQFVESNQISGAVTLVARRNEIVTLDAVGESDLAIHRKMRTDDLFWIASMTKPMSAAAVLMLQDEGKLSVDDPVQKYLPEFTNQWMIATRSATNMTLVRAPRAILIRDLLTHTSGLSDVPSPRPNASLAELVMAYAQQPLKFPPGSKWEYCNSGINTLGRIVEVVSGTSFAGFLQKRVFDPLDMDDTTFWPRASQAKRLARSYQPGANGALAETEIFFLKGGLSHRARTAYPSGGLFSTAHDMARFYQMMLHEGTWRGKRILSREAVAQMTRTQSGDIKTGFVDGMSWGYGFAVVKESKGITRMMSPGSFGHGGAYGTQSWADPKQDMIVILMIQRAKLPNADASPMRDSLQEAAVKAIAASKE
ncbi:MAG TPA: serine hydrolase domain-containing protein [Candidatus Limnocylindria bacterium]|nr:serine hydrolase domain-containing protein [Candidatus Limnocylindria bacterium]